jgi:hypothetical protein
MSLGRRIQRYFTGGDLLGREKYPKVVGINNVLLSSLATGLLKITTSTGIPSIATANDISSPVAAADAGASDTYTATLSPAPAAYVDGAHYRFKANTANTGACTINFNGLGAKTIKKVAGGITSDLSDNDIRVGQWVDLVYDGTNMQMQSTLGNAVGTSVLSPAFEVLTDGATVTWAFGGDRVRNAVVTLGGNRTLDITGEVDGCTGVLIVKQDGTGSRTLALPGSSKVVGGGAGAVTLTTTASAVDIISFYYDGTNFWWTYGKNFT